MNTLSKGYYADLEIDLLNKYIIGIDSELVKNKTYFIVENDLGKNVGCGRYSKRGWSKRATIFGGDQAKDRSDNFLNPEIDAAKIRAFFTHPDFAKCGIAKKFCYIVNLKLKKLDLRKLN